MGLLYLTVSPSKKGYVGQHNSNDFEARKQSHKYRYDSFLKELVILEDNRIKYPDKEWPKFPLGYCTALLLAFKKYGIENFTWSILETNVALELLNDLEDKYIIEHNTLSPNGYNLKLNNNSGGSSSFSLETLERMSISQSKVFETKLHKYRQNHEELEGVPRHVTFFESGGIRGYRIHNHPNCPSKDFTSATTPVPELKEQMLSFLKKCETTPFKSVQRCKAETDVPKGMTEQSPGKFLIQFAYKGTRYTKFFGNPPREKALADATIWMANKRKELKEEGSETK